MPAVEAHKIARQTGEKESHTAKSVYGNKGEEKEKKKTHTLHRLQTNASNQTGCGETPA